ncbi:MAG: lamin tail domain-containing protein, partial [Polyangiaceae bacterium]
MMRTKTQSGILPRLALATVTAFAVVGASLAGCSSEANGPESVGEATQALSSGLVIAEVYGGGGNANATYTHDYVVLFNRGTTSVSLNGLYLQYAATGSAFTYNAAADAGTQDIVALPNVSVAPGKYFLVQLNSNAAVGAALPTPDASATYIALAAANGKVALVSQPLNACGTTATPCATTNIVDFVGYGSAQQFEGSGAVGARSATTAGKRKAGGCTETDNNAQDFEVGAPT